MKANPGTKDLVPKVLILPVVSCSPYVVNVGVGGLWGWGKEINGSLKGVNEQSHKTNSTLFNFFLHETIFSHPQEPIST